MAEPGFSAGPPTRRAALRVLPGGAPYRTAPAGTPVRVYVLGADALARAGIRALLDGHPALRIIGDGEPAPGTTARLAALHPDVVLAHGTASTTPPAPGCPVLVVGGPVPDAVTWGADPGNSAAHAPVHGHLPVTATAEQLACAAVLAAGGYAVLPYAAERPVAGGDRGGPRPVTVSDVGPEALTDRERQVLELVADGLTNAEIAGALTLSEHTVKTHVQNLLGKLRLRNRVHAVIYAFETGLHRPR